MKKLIITEDNFDNLKDKVFQAYLSANDTMRTNWANTKKIMAGKKIIPTRIYLGVKTLPNGKLASYYLILKSDAVKSILKGERQAIIGKSFKIIEEVRKKTLDFSR